MSEQLILQQFSQINKQRCERWHPMGINSWSLSDWLTATAGELGEAANVIKKLNRIRDGLTGNGALTESEIKIMLGKEIADTFCYLDLLATAAGFSLAELVKQKFNEISDRNGFPEKV